MLTTRRIILVGALAASLLAMAYTQRGWRTQVLADDLRRQLHTATDAELPAVFGQIAALGDDGIALAAEALGSANPSLASAARDYLERRLAEIEALPPAARAPHFGKLAAALAAEAEGYGPTASRWSAEMAGKMLRLAPDNDRRRRDDLLAACETLIRHAASDAPAAVLAQQSQAAGDVAGDEGKGESDEARAMRLAEEWIVEQLAKYDTKPDGGLPLLSVEVPALPIVRAAPVVPDPPIAGSAAPADEEGRTPRPFEQPPDAERMEENPGRLRHNPQAEPVRSQPRLNAPIQIGGTSAHSAPRQPEHARTDRHIEQVSPSVPLAQRETLSVIREWSRSVEPRREMLTEELRSRGFTERDFLLASKLTDADPEVRRKLAETLPRIAGLSASPWLWWLAEDGDAQVRLAAISLLATSSDPAFRKRLSELADRESNSQVAARLRDILSARPR
jgi:hypothetical protein